MEKIDNPNIGFLSSALNNMLVSGILQGINISLNALEFGSKDNKNVDPNDIKTIRYDQIEILDAEIFEKNKIKNLDEVTNSFDQKKSRKKSYLFVAIMNILDTTGTIENREFEGSLN